jgi:hypothetical protein
MRERSPVNFWILLAATVCVDAVAFSWAEAAPGGSYGFVAFEALVLSQISVVCIWSGLKSEKSMWTRFSPFLAVVLALLVWGMISERHFIGKAGEEWSVRMGLLLVNHGLHAALLLAMFWLLKRTAIWKRRGGLTAEWQFSIADLLVGMTVVAVLGVGMRLGNWYVDWDWQDWTDIVFIGGSAVLAMSSVLIWSLWRTPWILRASGVMGVALGLVAVVMVAEWLAHLGPQRSFPPAAYAVVVATHYLIQALVLMAWLAWGRILPVAEPADAAPSNPEG